VIEAPSKRVTEACKPPRTYPAEARLRSLRQHSSGVSVPAGSSLFCRVASGRMQRHWLYVHCQRNAVGHVGVKLGAAPDAPQWGEVLVRTPSGRFLGARWRATSKITCLSRELPACPAQATNTGGVKPGGAEPRSRWPASSGGGGRGGRKACWPEAGLRIARYPAWAVHQANAAANAAKGTRQRASVGRACGQGPHPGKDPL
jgi:hypothetical protein